MPSTERNAWRLLAVSVGAGALLALLAIALALWSKQLVKDSARAECSAWAERIVREVRFAQRDRVQALLAGRARPPEVARTWTLRRDGRDRSDPPGDGALEPGLRAAALALGGELPRGLSLPGSAGPRAATWVPRAAWPAPDPACEGLLVLWDLPVLEARVIRPLLEPGDSRYEAALLRPGGLPAFHARGNAALDPPLAHWRVGVGLRDPEAFRRNHRLQTALLGALALWLLVLLAGSAVLYARRERSHAARLEAREQFLARAYHELQTPLALMRAAAETMQRGAVERPQDLARCVDIMSREEERLTGAIRRLLRTLRLEHDPGAAGELAPLGAELRRGFQELRPSLEAPGRTLELELNLDSGLLAPRELVRDTLAELLANVRKHAPEATRVRVQAEARGERARLVVADDGPGPSSSDEGPRGLGLVLLREGWGHLGGGLSVAPAASGGTRVEVEVPCRRS